MKPLSWHTKILREDFIKTADGNYQLEYLKSKIGEGSNLITEKKNEDGSYTVIQIPIKKHNESIFIAMQQPIDSRIIFN